MDDCVTNEELKLLLWPGKLPRQARQNFPTAGTSALKPQARPAQTQTRLPIGYIRRLPGEAAARTARNDAFKAQQQDKLHLTSLAKMEKIRRNWLFHKELSEKAKKVINKIVLAVFILGMIPPVLSAAKVNARIGVQRNAARMSVLMQDVHELGAAGQRLNTAGIPAFPALSPRPELRHVPDLVPQDKIHTHDRYKHITAFELGDPNYSATAWLDSGGYAFGHMALHSGSAVNEFMSYLGQQSPKYYEKMRAAVGIIKDVNFRQVQQVRNSYGDMITRLAGEQDRAAFALFKDEISRFGDDAEFKRLERAFIDRRYAYNFAEMNGLYGFDINNCDEILACIVLPAMNNGPARMPAVMQKTLALACEQRYGRVNAELLKTMRESKYLTTLSPARFAQLFYRANEWVLSGLGRQGARIGQLHRNRYNEFLKPLDGMVAAWQAERIAQERIDAMNYNTKAVSQHASYNAWNIGESLDTALAQLASAGRTYATASSLDSTVEAVRHEIMQALPDRIMDGEYNPTAFGPEVVAMFKATYENEAMIAESDIRQKYAKRVAGSASYKIYRLLDGKDAQGYLKLEQGAATAKRDDLALVDDDGPNNREPDAFIQSSDATPRGMLAMAMEWRKKNGLERAA